MRLEKASFKAIKYAVMNWHYSKSVPSVQFAHAVFNSKSEWCGVVCYGMGAANNIARPYNLRQGNVIELVRIAMNGKQESTSKALAISLKLLKKNNPHLKLIVSYADSEQGHSGIIYQATNWIFTGDSTDTNIVINGKRMHRRSIGSKYGTSSIGKLKRMGLDCQIIQTKPKHKYIYPLTKDIRELCLSLSKPYPKKTSV